MNEKKYELELVSGVEGPCVCLNNYRVAGPKPWGGGQVTRSWRVTGRDLLDAVPDLLAAERARIREELLAALPAARYVFWDTTGTWLLTEVAVAAALDRICPAQETPRPRANERRKRCPHTRSRTRLTPSGGS